eukprot:2121550-Lingulodinium_polyedra.AAC.1
MAAPERAPDPSWPQTGAAQKRSDLPLRRRRQPSGERTYRVHCRQGRTPPWPDANARRGLWGHG